MTPLTPGYTRARMASKKLRHLTEEEVWTRWNERMTKVRQALHHVFATRWQFRAVTEMFERNDALKAVGGDVHRWLFLMWARDVVIAVRRELDNDTNTVCLGRLLDEMAQRPRVITRARFLGRVSREDARFRMLDKTFTSHAIVSPDPAQPMGDHLDPEGISRDRKHLYAVAKPVLAYANQILAHRNEDEDVPVTLGDINRAVDEIEAVFLKYYTIINGPTLMGLEPSVIGNWTKPFEIPWLAPEQE
jgi:hypothetical protein